jgi:lipopolysaccharide transport system ATP-binding protein
MYVQIHGEVHQFNPALILGYAIYSEEEFPVYQSNHTDRPEAEWPRLTCGKWVFRGRIPAMLLNEGAYRIELMGSLHNIQRLIESKGQAPDVTLLVVRGLSNSPYWTNRRPGIIAPMIAWSAQPVKHL